MDLEKTEIPYSRLVNEEYDEYRGRRADRKYSIRDLKITPRTLVTSLCTGLFLLLTVASIVFFNLGSFIPSRNHRAPAEPSTTSPHFEFRSYHPDFEAKILGPDASSELLFDEPYKAFHEAGVYNRLTNSVYIASSFQSLDNPINVTIVNLTDYSVTSVRYPGLAQANGGCPYTPPAKDGSFSYSTAPPYVLFCDEGDYDHMSGLVYIDPATNETKTLVDNFFGRNFSSLNDVKQHPVTGDLWFTDCQYGYLEGFRPLPAIPPQVYRFEPATGILQAAADGFVQSNGFEFSPDGKIAYVTDTGSALRLTDINMTRPSSIYAFDVVENKSLQNRRLFAYSDAGVPDGIHTDEEGNVYSACAGPGGDGIHVWNKDGVLLGKFWVNELGSNNFVFVPGGMLMFNLKRIWMLKLKAKGKDVARDFGL